MSGKRIARRLPLKPQREQLPEHLKSKMTLREFKRTKRKQALAAERALAELLAGAAYLPKVEGVYIGRILDDLSRARREWAKWWRNA